MASALSTNASFSGVELRKLPPSFRIRIGQLLDIQDCWKILMASIPSEKNPDIPKYTTEHMLLVERHGRFSGKSCGEILIDEWSTSGRVRPTPEILLDLLVKCQLYRAADFVATEVLSIPPPDRPAQGPAARIPNLTQEQDEQSVQSNNERTRSTLLQTDGLSNDDNLKDLINQLNNQDPESGNLVNFNAATLELTTRNFDESLKIGSGAFGEVFKLDLSQRKGPVLAVKVLHPNPSASIIEDQFLTEIRALSVYRHENLVPLVGFCSSAPKFCLIYEFMPRGSLLNAIACEEETTSPLNWDTRISVAYGIARGIRYLHYGKEKPLIHRDIKSANVLLDHEMTPKLGDFGLAKSLSSNNATSALTSTIIGTSAYMAPEAFRGDISPKMDVFSFGVIILELLTGLAPYDEDREGNDIVTFMEDTVEEDDISPFLDTKAGPGNEELANALYSLSQKCLEDKRRRLTSDRVVQELECVLSRFDRPH